MDIRALLRAVMEEATSAAQISSLPVQSSFSGVKIREFDDSTANPEPIKQEEDTDQLLEEFLSANKLVRFGNAGFLWRPYCARTGMMLYVQKGMLWIALMPALIRGMVRLKEI